MTDHRALVQLHSKAIGTPTQPLERRVIDVFLDQANRAISEQEVGATWVPRAKAPTVVPVAFREALRIGLTRFRGSLLGSKARGVGVNGNHGRRVGVIEAIKAPVALQVILALPKSFAHHNRFRRPIRHVREATTCAVLGEPRKDT